MGSDVTSLVGPRSSHSAFPHILPPRLRHIGSSWWQASRGYRDPRCGGHFLAPRHIATLTCSHGTFPRISPSRLRHIGSRRGCSDPRRCWGFSASRHIAALICSHGTFPYVFALEAPSRRTSLDGTPEGVRTLAAAGLLAFLCVASHRRAGLLTRHKSVRFALATPSHRISLDGTPEGVRTLAAGGISQRRVTSPRGSATTAHFRTIRTASLGVARRFCGGQRRNVADGSLLHTRSAPSTGRGPSSAVVHLPSVARVARWCFVPGLGGEDERKANVLPAYAYLSTTLGQPQSSEYQRAAD